jgi:hypothetical protein
MITRSSKTFASLLAAATLALSTAALTSPAQAHWHGGWGPGFGIGLGLGLGLGMAPAVTVYDAPVACRIVNTYDRFGNYLGKMRRCG